MSRTQTRGRRRRRRRRNPALRGAIVAVLCLALAGGGAFGAVRAVGMVKTSQQRKLRTEGEKKLESGDYSGALTDFETAIESLNKDTGALALDLLCWRAEAEYRLEDYEAALHTYELLMERDEKETDYVYLAALTNAALGNDDEALALYNQAKQSDGKKKEDTVQERALDAVTAILAKAGRADEAVALYQESMGENPDGKKYLQMAVYQMDGENYDSASLLLDQAESFAGEDEELKKEVAYTRAVLSEYRLNFSGALEQFRSYVATYGEDERAQHEITFLESR